LQVTWIRHRDVHILTVGEYTYTTDERFAARHNRVTGEWVLVIKYAQERDAGGYECQIPSTEPQSYKVNLNIVGKVRRRYHRHRRPSLPLPLGCAGATSKSWRHFPRASLSLTAVPEGNQFRPPLHDRNRSSDGNLQRGVMELPFSLFQPYIYVLACEK